MKSINSNPLLASLLAVATALSVAGCQNLKVSENSKPGIVLPKARMESDSIAVRVAVAELDDLQKDQFKSFMRTTDSQKIPLKTRQRLDENGLRVSVVNSVNSSTLQKLLTPRTLKPEWLSEQELELANAGKLEPVHRLAAQRHVEKKRGESFSIEVSAVRPVSTWQIHVGEQSFTDQAALAQCQLRVTSWPNPDGSVQMRFVPEIHHGENLSRIGVSGQDFAVEKSRDIKELRSLEFGVTIQPGETVVIAATEGFERIGELFFGIDQEYSAEAASDDEQSIELATKDDPLIAELFPMLGENDSNPDPSLLIEDAQLEDITLADDQQRPQRWQRFLLVHVVEVTPSELP